MIRKIAPGLVLCALGGVGPMGCIGNHADPLDSRVFIVPGVAAATQPVVSHRSDSPEMGQVSNTVGEMPEKASVLPDPMAPNPRPFDAIEPIGELTAPATTQPVIVQSAESTAPTSVAVPAAAVEQPQMVVTTQPSASSASNQFHSSGVYMTLGGVIAIVDGVPIYTHEVLAPLKKRFSVKAHELDARQFKQYAAHEIDLQLRERVEGELTFAQAYHSLSDDDRAMTDAAAMMIRHERVTAAGGSVEEARRIAAEHGDDFDESVKQEYRLLVVEVCARREQAAILVSADAMRDFYRENLSKFYSTKAQAQFRVIEIDPDKCKTAAAAKEKADAIREKAVNGTDFAALASAENDDHFLKSRGGSPMDPGQWMERNTFMVDAVDAAVWELQPGQVTPVIESKGKLYIAKMEARRGGTVQPFEDPTVQADIYEKVGRAQQNHVARQLRERSAIWDSVVGDEKREQLALEIAMQQYAQVQAADQAGVSSTGH